MIGTATTIEQGIELIQSLDPQLLFLDIQLKTGTGFDLLTKSNRSDLRVIFTTAYEEYALKAFEFNAIDYLLKPVSQEDLNRAIQKVKQWDNENYQLLMKNFISSLGNLKNPKKIAIATSTGINILEVNDIIRINSERNYSRIYCQNQPNILSAKSLKEYDQLLSSDGFFRVHQSHLVNVQHIQKYLNMDGGYLIMSDESKVEVANRKRHDLLELLSNI